jgi:hypothetical protein
MCKGTSADRPGNAHLFDFVACSNCAISSACLHKDGKEGCRFGVEGHKNENNSR